jgi:ketosteroid isomerase-like protein
MPLERRSMIKRKILITGLALASGASLLMNGASAASDPASVAKAEVTKAVRAIEERVERGVDATTFVHELFTDDVVIVGEHPGAQRGAQAEIESVQAWLDYLGPSIKTCKWKIEEPVIASATTVSSFIVLSCKANPPSVPKDEVYTTLYIWKKYPQGWRVALEMWNPGQF